MTTATGAPSPIGAPSALDPAAAAAPRLAPDVRHELRARLVTAMLHRSGGGAPGAGAVAVRSADEYVDALEAAWLRDLAATRPPNP